MEVTVSGKMYVYRHCITIGCACAYAAFTNMDCRRAHASRYASLYDYVFVFVSVSMLS